MFYTWSEVKGGVEGIRGRFVKLFYVIFQLLSVNRVGKGCTCLPQDLRVIGCVTTTSFVQNLPIQLTRMHYKLISTADLPWSL